MKTELGNKLFEKPVSLIACLSSNNVIGYDNKLMYSIPNDIERFKKITTGNGNNAIIMGRKTFESIGCKPLPNRMNIVISLSHFVLGDQSPLCDINFENLIFVNNITVLKTLLCLKNIDEIFIIGGQTIYEQTIDLVDRMYLTIVHNNVDIFNPNYKKLLFFPKYDELKFREICIENFQASKENKYPYSFINYVRIN